VKKQLKRGKQLSHDVKAKEALQQHFQRHQELRKKIETTASDDDSQESDEDETDAAKVAKLLQEIDQLQKDVEDGSGAERGVYGMGFMKRAEEKKKHG